MLPVTNVDEVRIGERHALGGSNGLLLIAGPCVIESRDHCLRMAAEVAGIASRTGVPTLFKASWDKANRTSLDSYRGPGLDEGLRILEEAGRETGLPVTSDVHEPSQVAAAAGVLDLIQVPAFLCRQTDLLVAAGRSGKPVNVKKGQFLAPQDVRNILDKVRAAGGSCVITERGASFGYNNLVTDPRAFPWIRSLGAPVVFDATHSMQQPGGLGSSTGGTPEYCAPVARAAAAAGVDGFFFEVHDDPPRALSDPTTQVEPAFVEALLPVLVDISARVRETEGSGP